MKSSWSKSTVGSILTERERRKPIQRADGSPPPPPHAPVQNQGRAGGEEEEQEAARRDATASLCWRNPVEGCGRRLVACRRRPGEVADDEARRMRRWKKKRERERGGGGGGGEHARDRGEESSLLLDFCIFPVLPLDPGFSTVQLVVVSLVM
jgi:hypothetical protein